MENGNHHVIDLSAKAKEAGIELPVDIDRLLLEELTPAPFLASLGLSLGERIDNLLNLVNAHLTAHNGFKDMEKTKIYLPFMAVKGPFVREEYVPVIAKITQKEGGRPVITLAKADDE